MKDSKYPLDLDNYNDLDLKSESFLKKVRSAIISVENELGIYPSGDFQSVSERLKSLDEKEKKIFVSSTDSNPGDLEYKISSGKNITIKKLNIGGNERLEISSKVDLDSIKHMLDTHSTSHEIGGNDEILIQNLSSGNEDSDLFLKTDGYGGVYFSEINFHHNKDHEKDGSDELTLQNLSSGYAPYGNLLVSDGLGGWVLEKKKNDVGTGIIPILTGVHTTNFSNEVCKGACVFDTSLLKNIDLQFDIHVVLQVTDPSIKGYFQLYSVLDDCILNSCEISSSSEIPELVISSLKTTHLSSLVDSFVILEARMWVEDKNDLGGSVICKYAAINIKNRD